jgi:hypothetical protein
LGSAETKFVSAGTILGLSFVSAEEKPVSAENKLGSAETKFVSAETILEPNFVSAEAKFVSALSQLRQSSSQLCLSRGGMPCSSWSGDFVGGSW